MDWTPGGRSSDLEDRRGGGGFGIGGGGLGIGGFVIVLLLSLVFHRNFFSLLGVGGGEQAQTANSRPVNDPAEEPEVQFVSFVLDDAQKNWTEILAQRNIRYPHAKLVLFRDRIASGCGMAQSATGPFYCPEDQKVYIDLGFYDELKKRFGAPGDFAQAYVLAHEIGHHVQNVLGIEEQMQQAVDRGANRNDMSVRLELQADCFAGIWAHTTDQRQMLDAGDAKEAINAAAAVGDDRLQRMSGRGVSPEKFTHGSSEQRMHWFEQGFSSGNIASCNTFAQ
jgi:predicted metalloprotease